MRFSTTFKSAAIIMAATAVGFTTPASAHDNGYYHTHQNSDDQLIGGAIGAVAGGVLGSQLAGNGARTEGSILGAVIGGVAGAAIAGDGRTSHGGYYRTQGGYYNPQTGYYGGGYSYPSQGYYGNSYYNYPSRTTYRTTYSAPTYYYRTPPRYYRAPRAGLTINIGNGGYYDRGYRHRHYDRGYRGHRGYRGYRGHRHTRHCHH